MILDSEFVDATIPCKLCGKPTAMLGTKLCDPCWELQRRIEHDPELARKILEMIDEVMKEIGYALTDNCDWSWIATRDFKVKWMGLYEATYKG